MRYRPYRAHIAPLIPLAVGGVIGVAVWMAPTVARFVNGRPWAWILTALVAIKVGAWLTRPRTLYVPEEWEREEERRRGR